MLFGIFPLRLAPPMSSEPFIIISTPQVTHRPLRVSNYYILSNYSHFSKNDLSLKVLLKSHAICKIYFMTIYKYLQFFSLITRFYLSNCDILLLNIIESIYIYLSCYIIESLFRFKVLVFFVCVMVFLIIASFHRHLVWLYRLGSQMPIKSSLMYSQLLLSEP